MGSGKGIMLGYDKFFQEWQPLALILAEKKATRYLVIDSICDFNRKGLYISKIHLLWHKRPKGDQNTLIVQYEGATLCAFNQEV